MLLLLLCFDNVSNLHRALGSVEYVIFWTSYRHCHSSGFASRIVRSSATSIASSSVSALPTADLKYRIRPSTVNLSLNHCSSPYLHSQDTASYYDFSNIRYASTPRFSSQVPNGIIRTTNDGQNVAIYPQSRPEINSHEIFPIMSSRSAVLPP
jgi:hypothetical protein